MGGYVTSYTYNSRGLRTSTKNYYEGSLITQTDYTYNLAGLATSLVNKNAEGDVLSSFSYTYQFDGNVSSETDHNGIVTNYTYDLLGRLIAEVNGASSKYYTYDNSGNRTKVIVDGVSQVLYTYNDKGQLATETKTNGETSEVISYTYDANGNLTSKTEGIRTTSYSYDTFGRMISAANVNYTYRPDGLRASKAISSGGTHYFAYVNGRLVRDCSDKYLYGLELIKSDNVFYLYNIHGDVIQLVTIGGSLYKTYDYDAYGNELTRDLNDTNPFRYCGEYYDVETGFIYLRARYYDPMVGRFTTVDPAKDGLNWYAYCNNNPVAFVDRNGLWPEWASKALAIAAIATIAVVSVAAIVTTAGAASAVVGAVATTYGTAVFGTAAGATIGTIATYATAAVAAAAATFITISAPSDMAEVITGQNYVCDTLFGRNRTNYEFCKGLSYVVASGCAELAKYNNYMYTNETSKSIKNSIPDDKGTLKHIFRNDEGHVLDTTNNRSLFTEVANSKECYLGKDMYNNEWYAKILSNGSQVWVEARNGRIFDAGINNSPICWNNDYGLKKGR